MAAGVVRTRAANMQGAGKLNARRVACCGGSRTYVDGVVWRVCIYASELARKAKNEGAIVLSAIAYVRLCSLSHSPVGTRQ